MFKDLKIFKCESCARTKTEDILNGVIAPESIRFMAEELQEMSFVGVQTDSSNHGSTKLFPICVQVF